MADGKQIRAGGAFYELALKDSGLTKGLARASAKLRKFGAEVRAIGTKIGGIGLGIAAPFAAAAATFAEVGSRLLHLSQQTGIAVETLSALGYAADQCGIDADQLAHGIAKMQKQIGGAERGSGEAIEAFAKLGVSLADISRLAPDEQFAAIADKISKLPDAAQRTAVAMQIFGRAGAELAPLLTQGGDGIKRFVDEARGLGYVLSQEDAENAEKLDRAFKSLKAGVTALTVKIGEALGGDLDKLCERLKNGTSEAIEFIKANGRLVVIIAGVGAALTVTGAAIYGVGVALSTLGVIGGVVASAFALMLSPLGLFAAALAAAEGAALYFSGGLKNLQSDGLEAFGAIKDALKSGDWEGALKILWALIKLEFRRGLNWIEDAWFDAKQWLLDKWSGLTDGIASLWFGTVAAITGAWDAMVTGLYEVWVLFTNGWRMIWTDVTDWFAKRLLDIRSLWDKTFNLAQAKADLDKLTGEKNKQVHDAAFAEINAAQRAHAAKIKAIDDERRARQAAIASAAEAERRAHQRQHDDNMRDLAAELAAAKGELASAVNTAAHVAAAKKRFDEDEAWIHRHGGGGKGNGDPFLGLSKSVAGSFNAFGAQGLGRGVGDMVSEQKRTNRILDAMHRRANHQADGAMIHFS